MSETPERKVLRKVLANLKSKSLASRAVHTQNVLSTADEISQSRDSVLKMKNPGMFVILQAVELLLNKLVRSSDMAIKDMGIYIDALEQYSATLDKTLIGIFERAMKRAKEQQKKQEELRKRKPSGMTV